MTHDATRFLSVLRRCAPLGDGPRPPTARADRDGTGLTLTGACNGVGLAYRVPGPCDPAAAADPLRAAGVTATAAVPALPVPSHWQPTDAAFVAAMRDAARVAGRSPHPRYAYHRVLVDAPRGKVAATDGVRLFAHDGFAWAGAAAVAVPAVGAWAAADLAAAGDVAVGFAADIVVARVGAWTLSLPVDRAARVPRYAEVLARLRAPAARFTLSAADAAAWTAALAGAGGRDDPAVLEFADPPALTIGPAAGRLVAAASWFAGRRAVRVACAAAHVRAALRLGFRALAAVGAGHPVVALDGPRRLAWAALDPG